MGSKKRPLWLTWKNPDPMAEISVKDFGIIFKNGDGKRRVSLLVAKQRYTPLGTFVCVLVIDIDIAYENSYCKMYGLT